VRPENKFGDNVTRERNCSDQAAHWRAAGKPNGAMRGIAEATLLGAIFSYYQ